MKRPKGKKSSPLDDITPERWTAQFTTELLELLWILEATIATYPEQAKLLTKVIRKATLTLLNESGVCDLVERERVRTHDQRGERFCNSLAAAVLMPPNELAADARALAANP